MMTACTEGSAGRLRIVGSLAGVPGDISRLANVVTENIHHGNVKCNMSRSRFVDFPFPKIQCTRGCDPHPESDGH